MGEDSKGNRTGLAFVLLALLLCSGNTFAGEPVDAKNRKAAANSVAAARAISVPRNAVLDQLTGTWDVAYEYVGKDGTLKHSRGQVHYGWILDGRALQEVWTSDASGPDLRPYGTTINFYDSKQQRWTAVWVYPAEAMTTIVSGGDVNGSYVLTGKDESGKLQRWSTSVVEPDVVLGRFDLSSDDGRTWRQVGTNHMRRHRK
jgi:hypothetical protein